MNSIYKKYFYLSNNQQMLKKFIILFFWYVSVATSLCSGGAKVVMAQNSAPLLPHGECVQVQKDPRNGNVEFINRCNFPIQILFCLTNNPGLPGCIPNSETSIILPNLMAETPLQEVGYHVVDYIACDMRDGNKLCVFAGRPLLP